MVSGQQGEVPLRRDPAAAEKIAWFSGDRGNPSLVWAVLDSPSEVQPYLQITPTVLCLCGIYRAS